MIEGRANELPDFQVFLTVVKYCMVIIIAPILSFFIAKIFLFDGMLRLDVTSSNVYAAVVSVLVLHAFLGLYIYKAYSIPESAPPKPVKKD